MTAAPHVDSLPERALRTVFLGLSHRRALGRLATRVPVTRPMVSRFVAGETLPEVLDALERLRADGFETTVDVLGESVTSAAECGARPAATSTRSAALAEGASSATSASSSPRWAWTSTTTSAATRWRRSSGLRPSSARSCASTWRSTPRPIGRWRSGASSGRSTRTAASSSRRRSGAAPRTSRRSSPRARACASARAPTTSRPRVAFRERAEIDATYEALARRLMTDGAYPALATHDGRLIGRLLRFAAARRDRRGPLRVPDAVRRPARPAAPSCVARGQRGPRLRSVRHRVVSVLHAPPRREAGQRHVPAALPHEGRPGRRREPPARRRTR